MSPQARATLPPELRQLTKPELVRVIENANIGRENEKIARLYYVDRLPQVDVAAELYLGSATIKRRLPTIREGMQRAARHLKS